MVYNDTTNQNGILQEIEDYADLGRGYITGDTNNLKYFTSKVNDVMSDLWHTIFKSGGSWKYDDGNYTDLPTGTTDLVSGTYKYALPSEALTIDMLEVSDSNGSFNRLSVLDKENLKTIDHTQTGTPTHYYLVNGTAFLYPTPNYNYTNGLRASFSRAGVDFETSDTTQTPGFAKPYHYLVPLGTAISWLKIKQPTSPSLAVFMRDFEVGKNNLGEFISERFEDEGTPILKVSRQNFE